MRVTVLDYGVGNLHSLLKALDAPGVEAGAEADALRALETDVLVLPGVGAFGAAIERLAPARDAVRAALLDGLPCLGICLGMQLLFDSSEEGEGAGLGVVPGRVRRLRTARVPQMGWNVLEERRDPLLDASGLETAYFANSYICQPSDERAVRASSVHEGERFASMVRAGRTVGVQFHPEKSSSAGVAFIGAFLEEARP
ncbi:MAG TPA: imidazole glycerol phosphate synthase subunit HisH [Gemmatimonadaceae bacterium]|nr:imidazole glycerol phosphate synthase subunit HisH [Gemmatimonadaceae bacterium]